MTTINFNVLPPPSALSRDVECLRISTHSGTRPLEVKVCPSGYPGIVFQLASDTKAAIESIAIRSAQTSNIPVLFLHGQGSEPSIMRFRGTPYTTIQLVFKPHALYSLFGWDAAGHNQGLLAPDQFDAVELERQLLSANSTDERVYWLNHFVMTHLKQTNMRDELIELILDYIREHIASIKVQDLLAVFHISERQFQKRFARVVGMPPHLYIRVRRVNEALRLMHSGQYERLSDVAFALNYYDQSHFIRDMKSFSWVSPKHIAMKVSDFHSDLAGSSYL
ncbi:AraC family transcriptional regulator [Paenibacillus sp. N3.4]|uniref:helix-turn-helix domain-containing protein n=1 Tax=Paenibacillus sp. N3.4 TaxID=2603222 RepID=UPI0011C6F8C0|nr:AraC family transcriptional regulator [Paenibacillus sp. N3.4]TXK80691.1 helix-turn-helix transcriptional regulator [Paenibacillus sp. N3.4]